jgi:hypothetical protein
MPAEGEDARRQPDTRHRGELRSLTICNFGLKIDFLEESTATLGKRLVERMDASAAADEKAMANIAAAHEKAMANLMERMDASAAADEKAWAALGKRLSERMDASAAADEKAWANLEKRLSEKRDASAAADEKAWANLNETYKNDLRSSRWITGLIVGLVTLVTSALGAALSRYFLR